MAAAFSKQPDISPGTAAPDRHGMECRLCLRAGLTGLQSEMVEPIRVEPTKGSETRQQTQVAIEGAELCLT